MTPAAPSSEPDDRTTLGAVAATLMPPVVAAVSGLVLVPVMLHNLTRGDYAIWVSAATLSGIVAAFGGGIGWATVREAARSTAQGATGSRETLRGLAGLYGLLATTDLLVLGAAGLVVAAGSGDTPALWVFLLLGGSIALGQLVTYGADILLGLQRFLASATITSALLVGRVLCTIAALWLGGGLVSVAVAQCLATLAIAAVSLAWLRQRLPALSFRPSWSWRKTLRELGVYTGASELIEVSVSLLWRAPVLVLSATRGAAAAIPSYLGQRLPMLVASAGGRVAEVTFPIASRQAAEDLGLNGPASTMPGSKTLLFIMRINALTLLPLCVLLEIVADPLLHLWLGQPPTGTTLAFRLFLLAVMCELIYGPPLHTLWGAGRVRLVGTAALLTATATVPIVLLPLPTESAAAIATLAAAAALMVTLSAAAARSLRLSSVGFLSAAFSGMMLPLLVATAAAVALERAPLDTGLRVVLPTVAGAALYSALIYRFGLRPSERRLLKGIRFGLRPRPVPTVEGY